MRQSLDTHLQRCYTDFVSRMLTNTDKETDMKIEMDRTTLIATINAEIDTKLAALHIATPRVSTRRLAQGDYTSLLNRALDLVQDDDKILTLSEVGGFVPNSYGHRAETDKLTVVVDLDAGTAQVAAARTTAQSRPRGQGNCRVVRLQKEGQAQGRVVSW